MDNGHRLHEGYRPRIGIGSYFAWIDNGVCHADGFFATLSSKGTYMNPVELFLHGAGQPVVIEAKPSDVLRDVLAKHDALPRDGEFVYIGEVRHTKDDPDSEHDEQAPADLALTIMELGLPVKRHIHTRAARSITVIVEFNGESPQRSFGPNATVETVLVWAKHRLNIDPVAGAELVLETVPGGEVPRMDAYLSDLAHGKTELTFKLVKEVNPQGAA